MRSSQFGKLWEPEEETILKRYYPREGWAGVRKRLANKGFDRTKKAILYKAHKLMLYLGDIEGYVHPREVLQSSSSTSYYKLLFDACREGVLLELNHEAVKWLVPVEWAGEWLERPKRPNQY